MKDFTAWAVSLPDVQNLLHIHIQDMYLDDQDAGEVVDQLYNSILHRAADVGGYNYWVNGLKDHQFTIADVVYAIPVSQEMHQMYNSVMLAGITYTPTLNEVAICF